MVTGDFNGDGRTDLALIAGSAGDQGQVEVDLGAGDGTFVPQAAILLQDAPSALVAGDFNGDGRAGLAFVTAGGLGAQAEAEFALGLGDGTFVPRVTASLAASANGFVTGDFNVATALRRPGPFLRRRRFQRSSWDARRSARFAPRAGCCRRGDFGRSSPFSSRRAATTTATAAPTSRL